MTVFKALQERHLRDFNQELEENLKSILNAKGAITVKNLADDKPMFISKDTLEKMKDGKLYKLIVASIERNETPEIDEDPEYLRHAIQYVRRNR